MTPEEMGSLLVGQGGLLLAAAQRAGLDARVPSAPSWCVRELVRHQGMVHRWATANVLASGPPVNDSELEKALVYPSDDGLARWFIEGVDQLVTALSETPETQAIWTFFAGETPRRFWFRRQLHETAVHRMDAELAAGDALSAVPAAMAIDGIDELLTGFLQRRSARLRSDEPWSVSVRTDGAAWTVQVSAEPPVTVREQRPADATVSGPPAQLYAYLWNRARDGVAVEGDARVADWWRDGVRIQW
jgi:uncharacterized protein (TIGR03083 family)